MKQIAIVIIATLLTGCATPQDRQKWAIVAAAFAVGAVAYSVARNGGGGGGTAAADYDWDWDQFYNANMLVWACRGIQTGQFAEESRCAYKVKTDYRWPGK